MEINHVSFSLFSLFAVDTAKCFPRCLTSAMVGEETARKEELPKTKVLGIPQEAKKAHAAVQWVAATAYMDWVEI
jgi:hypothetical protein